LFRFRLVAIAFLRRLIDGGSMVHQQKNEFCEEGRMKKAGTEAKNEREREAGSKKLFPGFILTEC